MALKTPNFSKCSIKKKCLVGPNSGVAYSPGDECDAPYVFDAATCDCLQAANQARFAGVSYHYIGGTEFFWISAWQSLDGPDCQPDGCAFTWMGAPLGFEHVFTPAGAQALGFENGVTTTIKPGASCSGGTSGCYAVRRNIATGGYIDQIPSGWTPGCDCDWANRGNGIPYRGCCQPGCSTVGTWEFRTV
jgi:hypothetical protein